MGNREERTDTEIEVENYTQEAGSEIFLLQQTVFLWLKTALDIWPAAEVITADLDKYKSNSSSNCSESVLVIPQITVEFI